MKKQFEKPECYAHILKESCIATSITASAPGMPWDNEEGEIIGSNGVPSRVSATNWNDLSGLKFE